MTLPGLLRVVGVLLAVLAAASAALGAYSAFAAVTAAGGPDPSFGILLLFMGTTVQSLWQTVAGCAMALFCFAAARLLDAARR